METLKNKDEHTERKCGPESQQIGIPDLALPLSSYVIWTGPLDFVQPQPSPLQKKTLYSTVLMFPSALNNPWILSLETAYEKSFETL